ncbi:MAG: MBL fold metallo-hydrolase, partial [Saprospiraceae bacterium]
MKIEQIYTGCLAQGAYFIQSDGEAAVIDPLRETEPYQRRALADGLRIKYIFETHFHADFVSGHLDLARQTGATVVYGPGADTSYDKHNAADGEEFRVGKLTIRALHTPGHTLESTCYLLLDEAGEPHALFTGDTLFIGDVGRPDLAQKGAELTQEDLAGMLYDSLREKVMTLPDKVIVYPAHGAGSACGKKMSRETTDTLGNQKENNYALRADMTREEFVEEVTDGLLPPPAYFAENARINKQGYERFDEVLERGDVALSPADFEERANRTGALILDVRDKTDFVKGFIPNSVFIGLDGSFAPWVGALIPDLKQPILLVVPEGRGEEAVTRLARVGYDNAIGFLDGGLAAWRAYGGEVDVVETIKAPEYANRLTKDSVSEHSLLDVRKPSEYEAGHLDHAANLPLDFLSEGMNRLDKAETYYLHCGSG